MKAPRELTKVEVRTLFRLFLCESEEFALSLTDKRQHGGSESLAGGRESFFL